MAVMLCQVDWLRISADDGEQPYSFTDIESITVNMKSDNTANTARVVLKNPIDRLMTSSGTPYGSYVDDAGNTLFNEGDSVKIYAALIDDWRSLDTTAGSADLLMSGEISEVSIKSSEGGAKVTLEITDKTYVLLNRVWTFPYIKSLNKNAPEIVQDVVRKVSDNVENDLESYDTSGNLVSNGTYSVDARLVSEGTTSLPGFIEDTRIDGSAFPDIAKSLSNKPAYQWLKELSTIDATNDFAAGDNEDAPTQNRNMLFYIDELNRLHWYYPRDKLLTTLNGAINDSVTTVTLADTTGLPDNGSVYIDNERIDYIGISTNDLTNCTRGANNTTAASHSDGAVVKNTIQLTEGDTSGLYKVNSGANLQYKTFDIINCVYFTCGQDLYGNGISHLFFDKTTKSKQLKDCWKSYNDISKELFADEIAAGNLILDDSQTDFVHKGHYYKADTYGFTTSWGVDTTGFSDDDYNDAFRTEAKSRGTISAQRLTQMRGSPRWKGSIPIEFARISAGTLIEFTSTRIGINQRELRVTQSQYNITKTGGYCTLTVEEDERKKGEA